MAASGSLPRKRRRRRRSPRRRATRWGSLAVELSDLSAALGGGLLEAPGERHDDASEADQADQEPEPLDGGHNRDSSHVGAQHPDNCRSVRLDFRVHNSHRQLRWWRRWWLRQRLRRDRGGGPRGE
eukprot:749729-Hanusia_phi.AAC.4